MELTQDKYSAVILTGGLSSRMKEPKHRLQHNNQNFLTTIEVALAPLDVKYSVHDYWPELETNRQIIDTTDRIGPIGGIYSSLLSSTTDYLLVTSCDLPNLSKSVICYLIGFHTLYGGSVISAVNGKLNPTFGIYRKADLPIIKQAIDSRDYKLVNLAKRINATTIDIPTELCNDLINVNTRDQLKAIQPPFTFCVCGFKNSGKTTLINELITLFKIDGYKVSILKHDGHDFTVDTTTDTGKFIESKADNVTIYSNNKYQTTTYGKLDIDNWLDSQTSDIIIIEGQKDSKFPKVVIENNQKLPSSNRIMTIDKHSRNDIQAIYQKILEVYNEGQY